MGFKEFFPHQPDKILMDKNLIPSIHMRVNKIIDRMQQQLSP
jgi:hypothetical protein